MKKSLIGALLLLFSSVGFAQITNPPTGSGLPTGCTGTTGVITCTDFEGSLGVTAQNPIHGSTIDATTSIVVINDFVHKGNDTVICDTTDPIGFPFTNSFSLLGCNSASITAYGWSVPTAESTTPAVLRVVASSGHKNQLSYGSNCSAAGSAANPSLVACTGGTEGAFSCATNASTGTCVVSTTAVTANSNIFVQPSAALGTRLSVTCNTTADTGLTAPRIASISAGTSFTINLGTFTTNPECFDFFIAD